MGIRIKRGHFFLTLVLLGAAFGVHRLYAQQCFKKVSSAVIGKRALTDDEKAVYLDGLRALPMIRLFDLEDYLKVDSAYVAALFEDALKTRGADQWSAGDIEKLAQWGGRFQELKNHLLAGNCFEKCIAFSPVDRVPKGKIASWHLFAGQNLKLAGLDEEAIKHLKEAATLDQKDYRPGMLLANAYAERFDHTGSLSDLMLAYKYAEGSLKLKPDQPQLQELYKKLALMMASEATKRPKRAGVNNAEKRPEDEFLPKIPALEPIIPEPVAGDEAEKGFKAR